jgi:hypothetical protein
MAAGLEPSFLIHSQKECLDRISRRAVAFLLRGLLQVAYQVTSDWRLFVRDPLCMRVCLNNVLSCRIITLHLLQSKGQHYERIFKNGRSKWGFSHALMSSVKEFDVINAIQASRASIPPGFRCMQKGSVRARCLLITALFY